MRWCSRAPSMSRATEMRRYTHTHTHTLTHTHTHTHTQTRPCWDPSCDKCSKLRHCTPHSVCVCVSVLERVCVHVCECECECECVCVSLCVNLCAVDVGLLRASNAASSTLYAPCVSCSFSLSFPLASLSPLLFPSFLHSCPNAASFHTVNGPCLS
jgi:hypothetical protein